MTLTMTRRCENRRYCTWTADRSSGGLSSLSFFFFCFFASPFFSSLEWVSLRERLLGPVGWWSAVGEDERDKSPSSAHGPPRHHYPPTGTVLTHQRVSPNDLIDHLDRRPIKSHARCLGSGGFAPFLVSPPVRPSRLVTRDPATGGDGSEVARIVPSRPPPPPRPRWGRR